jgi:spermidine synthase
VKLVLTLALATLALPGAAVGWAFTALAAAAARLWRVAEAVRRVYVVESLGSLAGGLLVTLLVGRTASLRLLALCGCACALLALAAAARGVVSARVPLALAALATAAVAATSALFDAPLERMRFAATAPGVALRAVLDTPYQHLELGGDEVRHLYASGQYAGSFPDPYAAEALGHLAALLAPRPSRVLLVGGGERGLVSVLLRHPVAELTLVEPDAAAWAFLQAWLPAADRAALRDPRVRVVAADPRRFVSEPTGAAFDLVLLPAGEPTTLLAARLCSSEFFEALAGRLSPEGALVVPLHTAPAVLTGETAAVAGALVRTLRGQLPVVRVTPGPDALVVAGWSRSALTLDPAVLARRWAARGLRSDSFDPALLAPQLEPGRVAAQEQASAAAAATAARSSDDRPLSFLHALARRQQTTSGPWGRRLARAVALPPPALVALGLAPSLFVLLRLRSVADPARRTALAASHAVAVVGAAGLGWSLLLLFSFQAHLGTLYGLIGALIAAFMLGLALGAGLARRAVVALARNPVGRPGAERALRAALGVALAFALLLAPALAAAARVSAGSAWRALAVHGALLLAAGVVTGSVFPLAVELRLACGDGPAEAAGRIETADHVGASLASLTGGVLFVPLLGLFRSALVLAALLALALAAVARPARGTG